VTFTVELAKGFSFSLQKSFRPPEPQQTLWPNFFPFWLILFERSMGNGSEQAGSACVVAPKIDQFYPFSPFFARGKTPNHAQNLKQRPKHKEH